MRLVSSYLWRQLLASTVLVAVALTLIVWLTQSLKLLELVVNGGAPLRFFGYLMLLTAPRFLEVVLPLALAFATLFVLNKLYSDSELVVMQTTGLSPKQLARPLIGMSMVVALCILALGGWLTPTANLKLDHLKGVIKSDYGLALLRPGVFNNFGQNITVYLAKQKDATQVTGLLIHVQGQNGAPNTTITAKSGAVQPQADGSLKLIIYNGQREQFNATQGQIETLKFKRYELALSALQKQTATPFIDAGEKTLPQLQHDISHYTTLKSPEPKSILLAEFHTRLAQPLLTLAFVLVVAVPIFIGNYARRGQTARLFSISLALIILQGLFIAASNVAQKAAWANLLLYAVPLVPLVLCLAALRDPVRYAGYLTPQGWLRQGKERLL